MIQVRGRVFLVSWMDGERCCWSDAHWCLCAAEKFQVSSLREEIRRAIREQERDVTVIDNGSGQWYISMPYLADSTIRLVFSHNTHILRSRLLTCEWNIELTHTAHFLSYDLCVK
jgi:hypothetical protein